MFEPGELRWNAVDPATGVKLRIRSSADIDSKILTVEMPDGRTVGCGLLIEPAQSGTNQSSRIRVFLTSLNELAKFRNGTRSENTEFVRYILTGLSVIHRRWPIMTNACFYIDREYYKGRDLNSLFAFDVPDGDDILNHQN
jgi:hypothetical protein